MKADEVQDYIDAQPSPQREMCAKLRSLIKSAIPGIRERMALGVPYYDDLFYILSLKDHVNLGFPVKWLTEGERALLAGKGKTMRVMEFWSSSEIDQAQVVRMLQLVWARRYPPPPASP